MKATSSIGSAAGTDKAFGLSAASSTTGADASSGGGFLAMLDGMIQTMNAGQNPAGNNGQQSADQPDAGASDEIDALDLAADGTGDDLTLADTATTPSIVVAPTLIPAAITTTTAQPVAAKALTTPNALTDDALAALAVQAGVVPVAAPIVAAVQPDVTTPAPQSAAASAAAVLPSLPVQSVLADTIAAAPASQPVANIAGNTASTLDQTQLAVQAPVAAVPTTISITGQAPAKPAMTQSDQDNADSQQSAILSALFAQAPLQTIAPIVSADASAPKTQGSSPVSGASSAGPTSVLGVGTPPTLSPPAFVGNGNHLANQQGLVASATLASDNADDDVQAPTAHATPVVAGSVVASFSIGTDNSGSDSASDNSDDSDTAATAQSTPSQISSDAVKADAIASLFAAPQSKTSKGAAQDDAAVPVATTAAPSLQTGTPGLTFVHQSVTVAATATTANATATSASAYVAPAEQVSLVLQRAANTGAQSMTIALDPIELGKVEVKLDFAKDGSVQASVTAERPETLTLLKNDHSMLTQALHNAGLSTNSNSLSFNLRDGSNSSQQQQGFGSASSYRGRVDVTAAADDTISTSSTTVQYAVPSDNGRLNVIV